MARGPRPYLLGLLVALLAPSPAWAQGSPAAIQANLNADLVLAAFKGQRLAVVEALARGARLEATDANGYTALHWAAYGGHTALAGDLLARGAATEARTRVGQSPLMLAAWQGHAEVAELLLARGAQVQAVGPQGHTAEAYARKRGHLALAERLALAARPAPPAKGWCLFRWPGEAAQANPQVAGNPAAQSIPAAQANGGTQATPTAIGAQPRTGNPATPLRPSALPTAQPSLAPSWTEAERLRGAPAPSPWPVAAASIPPGTPAPRATLRPAAPTPFPPPPQASPSPEGPAAEWASPWWWLAGPVSAPAWALGPTVGFHIAGLSFPIYGLQLRRGLTQHLGLRLAFEQGGYQQAVSGVSVAYHFQRYHLALLSQGRLYGGLGVTHVVLGNAWDSGFHPSITAADLVGGLRWPTDLWGTILEPSAEFRLGLEGPSTANLGLAWRF